MQFDVRPIYIGWKLGIYAYIYTYVYTGIHILAYMYIWVCACVRAWGTYHYQYYRYQQFFDSLPIDQFARGRLLLPFCFVYSGMWININVKAYYLLYKHELYIYFDLPHKPQGLPNN